MRQIGDDLKAHLAEDATTLCHCWRVTRRDGVVLGFTDHDHDLAFDETTFLAASGFAASDWEAVSGLAAPSGDVAGALSSDVISEKDIAAGRYDGARVEQFLVNWSIPGQHIRLKVMEIGEITRPTATFAPSSAAWRTSSARRAAASILGAAMPISVMPAAARTSMISRRPERSRPPPTRRA
jgi:hypothetical protein